MEAKLTLDKAIRLIRQREVVKEQQDVLKQPPKENKSLDAVGEMVSRRRIPAIPPSAVRQPLVDQMWERLPSITVMPSKTCVVLSLQQKRTL